MTALVPWLRVLLAVLVFVVVALLASALVRRVGTDLREMQGRTDRKVAIIGLLANLAVLGVVLLMLVVLDGRPLSALGLGFTARDAVVLALVGVLTGVGVLGFLALLQATGRVSVRRSGSGNRGTTLGAVLMLSVLCAVALQEEVLFRGYVTVNLAQLGWVVVGVTSVALFTGVHLLTNRIDGYQVVSWAVGGGVLVMAYLLSGSIWLAVAMHFLIDITNVVAFGIVGQYSLVTLSPALSVRDRAGYRVVSSLAVAVLLLAAYGAHAGAVITSPPASEGSRPVPAWSGRHAKADPRPSTGLVETLHPAAGGRRSRA